MMDLVAAAILELPIRVSNGLFERGKMVEVIVIEADGTQKMRAEIQSETIGSITWEVKHPDSSPDEKVFQNLVKIITDYVTN